MVSFRTLCGIAGAGGLVTAYTGYTLHAILQRRVRTSPVYKEAMTIISNSPAGSKFLGIPIHSEYVDVNNSSNILSTKFSRLEIPVYGPKCKGVLYIEADRFTEEDSWNLYRLELEILDELGGKVSIINKEPVIQKSID